MQSANEEALHAVLTALGSSFILSGAKLTVTPNGNQFDASLTSGKAVLDGEVCHVEAANMIQLSQAAVNNLGLDITTQVATPSPVTYQDLQSRNAHVNRVAEMTVGGGYAYSSLNTLSEALRAAADPDPWHYVGDVGEPSFQNNWTAATPVGYRYEAANGRVIFRGRLKAGNNGSAFGTQAFTLPGAGYYSQMPALDYQPSAEVRLHPIGEQPTVSLHNTVMSVFPTGDVSFFHYSGAKPHFISLEGLAFAI